MLGASRRTEQPPRARRAARLTRRHRDATGRGAKRAPGRLVSLAIARVEPAAGTTRAQRQLLQVAPRPAVTLDRIATASTGRGSKRPPTVRHYRRAVMKTRCQGRPGTAPHGTVRTPTIDSPPAALWYAIAAAGTRHDARRDGPTLAETPVATRARRGHCAGLPGRGAGTLPRCRNRGQAALQ